MDQVKFLWVAVSVVGFTPLISAAAEDPEGVGDTSNLVELERMVVLEETSLPSSTELIDSVDIDRVSDSRTVDGLLLKSAGVDVKRTSPAAGRGRGVSLRGFDESRYLILLNGRPLNGSGVMGGHYVDWASLSKDNVEKIEIVRGPKSAEYGNTLGGSINIITKQGKDLPDRTKVKASYGIVSPEDSEDAYKNRKIDFSVNHSAGIGDAAVVSVFGSVAAGEPFLRNNDYRTTNIGGSATLFLPLDIEFAAGIRRSKQNRGFAIENKLGSPFYDKSFPESAGSAGGGPGIKWAGDSLTFGDRSYWKNIRTQSDFYLSKKIESIDIRGRLYLNDQDRTEYYYAATDTNRLVLERAAKPEKNTWGWKVAAYHSLTDDNLLTYGIEGKNLKYSQTDIRHVEPEYFTRPPSDGDLKETVKASERYAGFIQSSLNPINRLSITPGIRYDYYIGNKRDLTVKRTELHGVSPRAGVSVEAWQGSVVSVNWAFSNRYPTCPELYWYYNGYSFESRKDLSPEQAHQAEVGLSQKFSSNKTFSLYTEARGYYYGVNDYIRTIFGYRPSRLIYNIDNVSFLGAEFEFQTEIKERLAVSGNYTYQSTKKQGDEFDKSTKKSRSLPELPEHKANAEIRYTWENSSYISLSMRYVGERDVIQGDLTQEEGAELTHLSRFATLSLSGSYPLYSNKHLSTTLRFGVDNLLDTKYKEEPGIPMPGITGTAGIEFTF